MPEPASAARWNCRRGRTPRCGAPGRSRRSAYRRSRSPRRTTARCRRRGTARRPRDRPPVRRRARRAAPRHPAVSSGRRRDRRSRASSTPPTASRRARSSRAGTTSSQLRTWSRTGPGSMMRRRTFASCGIGDRCVHATEQRRRTIVGPLQVPGTIDHHCRERLVLAQHRGERLVDARQGRAHRAVRRRRRARIRPPAGARCARAGARRAPGRGEAPSGGSAGLVPSRRSSRSAASCRRPRPGRAGSCPVARRQRRWSPRPP